MSAPHTDALIDVQDAPPLPPPTPAVLLTESSPEVQQSRRVHEGKLAEILAGFDAGLSTREIAAKVGVSQTTVCRVATKLEDLTEGARKLLGRKAFDAIEDWARASQVAAAEGKHTAAKELLLHAHVIDPVGDSAAGPKVQINIGVPGQPVETPIMVNQAREGGNG